jgi:hypothetical protein
MVRDLGVEPRLHGLEGQRTPPYHALRAVNTNVDCASCGDLDWNCTSVRPLCRRPPSYSGHEIEMERSTGIEPVCASLATMLFALNSSA